MKPISVHVPENEYQRLKSLAASQGRPVAELIREAMRAYGRRALQKGRSLAEIPALDAGKMLHESDRSGIFDEMIGEIL